MGCVGVWRALALGFWVEAQVTRAYYNEIEPYAAEWLRNLILCELIADGDVDTRSIEDVRPVDLAGYTQCHFFAGIGVWSWALRRAGWPDTRPVWTGSCPCQPFSTAGQGRGMGDERHLWPAWFHLISECRPTVLLGEQVASKDAEPWVDLVHADLEALGYAFGAIPFPAAGVGAPHIRDRLYWVAHNDGDGRHPLPQRQLRADTKHDAEPRGATGGQALANAAGRGCGVVGGEALPRRSRHADGCEPAGGVADPDREAGRRDARQPFGWGSVAPLRGGETEPGRCGGASGLGDAVQPGSPDTESALVRGEGRRKEGGAVEQPGGAFWSSAAWIPCRDGKHRPVESRVEPMADGLARELGYVRTEDDTWQLSPLVEKDQTYGRTGRLRGYGNAICAPAAIEWIRAVMECMPTW